jgi:hypothetical protein
MEPGRWSRDAPEQNLTEPGATMVELTTFLGFYWLVMGLLELVRVFVDRMVRQGRRLRRPGDRGHLHRQDRGLLHQRGGCRSTRPPRCWPARATRSASADSTRCDASLPTFRALNGSAAPGRWRGARAISGEFQENLRPHWTQDLIQDLIRDLIQDLIQRGIRLSARKCSRPTELDESAYQQREKKA